jgi:lipopolysaccharide/colanic/teichoic acid biosynthesis glycosyltransferase
VGIGGDKVEEVQTTLNEIQRFLINNVPAKYLFAKRLIDAVVALLAIMLFLPLLLIISLWAKIHSKGAVLVAYKKYGLKGKNFKTYEFAGIVNPYIRKLPLLFNVLRGNMSLVGPQPFSTEDIQSEAWSHLRLSAKPGITGLWQVYGKAGEIDEMIRVDLKYIRERCTRSDLKILLKSLSLIFKKINRSKV